MSIGGYISPGLCDLLAPGQFSFLAPGFPIGVMRTIEEIRHDNLLLILREMSATEGGERGAIQRLAAGMDRSHSQVSQLKTKAAHSKTGKPRNIGSATARLIESAAGKPRGWLDAPHDEEGIDEKLARLVDAAVSKKLESHRPPPKEEGEPETGAKFAATSSSKRNLRDAA